MSSDLASRIHRAAEQAAKAGIDALLISPGADLRYLCGYRALPLERLTCLVVPAESVGRDPVLVVPALEQAAARTAIGDLELDVVPWQETDDPYALVADLLPRRGRVALDNQMWAEKVLAFRAAMPDTEQLPAGQVLTELRMRKTPSELDALAEAADAIDRVHARMAEWLRPGRTERQVGQDIADAILAEGHVQVDFTIVGSGPNAASPHHELSDRVICADEPVVVDIGGTTEAGYCSDSTRTYLVGSRAPAEFAAYYEVLLRAQVAACDHAAPGVTAESVDRAARQVIEQAGYGANFFHRTGHGIGMQGHEEPYIVEGNELVLEPGMVFSIEPGIYRPEVDGARIEDIVAVTETGSRRLNQRPRELGMLSGSSR